MRTENDFLQRMLSGVPMLIVEGYSECLAMDFRTYPGRSVDEPEKDKVMRGGQGMVCRDGSFQCGAGPEADPVYGSGDGNAYGGQQFPDGCSCVVHAGAGRGKTFEGYKSSGLTGYRWIPFFYEPAESGRMSLSEKSGTILFLNLNSRSGRM